MKYLSLKVVFLLFLIGFAVNALALNELEPKVVRFPNGELTLGGVLYLPQGDGPFPVVLYNHGSAPGMKSSMVSAVIGLKFAQNGWAFFMPYRRGQGLSESQGPYIMDQIRAARWNPFKSASKKLVDLHQGAHLSDQLAALSWLREQTFIDPARIATAGNSFGGIQVMLGMANSNYCAGINAAGAAESWQGSEELQHLLKGVAAKANGPIFFFQAENDYDLSPSKTLFTVMQEAGKKAQLKIYPAFGSSSKDGHSFPFRGVSIWFEDVLNFLNKQCVGDLLQ